MPWMPPPLSPLVLLTTLHISSQAFAAGKSTAEISAKTLKENKVELTFVTKAADGLVINHDGPWKLTVSDSGSIKLDKSEFKKEDWNEKNASFTAVGVTGAKKNSDIKYKMITFVCTKDKSQCFREVLDGQSSVTWK